MYIYIYKEKYISIYILYIYRIWNIYIYIYNVEYICMLCVL